MPPCRSQSRRLRWISRKQGRCRQQQRCSRWRLAAPTAAQRWMPTPQWALPAPAVHPTTVLQAMADILAGGAPPDVPQVMEFRKSSMRGFHNMCPASRTALSPLCITGTCAARRLLTARLSCQDHCLLQQRAAVQGSLAVLSVQRPVSSSPHAGQAESAPKGRAQPGERPRAWQRGCASWPA